jgi:hypothetical protein
MRAIGDIHSRRRVGIESAAATNAVSRASTAIATLISEVMWLDAGTDALIAFTGDPYCDGTSALYLDLLVDGVNWGQRRSFHMDDSFQRTNANCAWGFTASASATYTFAVGWSISSTATTWTFDSRGLVVFAI